METIWTIFKKFLLSYISYNQFSTELSNFLASLSRSVSSSFDTRVVKGIAFLSVIIERFITYILSPFGFTPVLNLNRQINNQVVFRNNTEGFITRFFNEFYIGIQDFLRRFRYL